MLFVASCGEGYDDTALRNDLLDLANRVAKLEQLCQQMNTNISSLQTIVNALQQNDFITAVVPVTQGGKVIGYTITFSRSGAITIYHGTDGKDGANGKDGSTPQIGVKKDSDGIYYWTLNGEWLLDANGNKIQAEGKDGADGANGSSGVDGITPQLKIDEGYWYISYDNGSTWTQLGKAVGEDGADGNDGIDGSDGQDGDSIFSKVTQDEECVYFYLSDGTMITLPKHDKENIQFEDLNVKMICCKNWDTNNDGELSYAEAAAVTDINTIFAGNDDIIAFDELKYFTGIRSDIRLGDCDKLWKISLPENVDIASEAFRYCINLQSVKIPEGLDSIKLRSFDECLSLKTIEIPSTVTTIEPDAFRRCIALSEMIIPEGVTRIGDNAFSGCSSLEYLELPSTLSVFGETPFHNCSGKVRVKCNLPDVSASYNNKYQSILGSGFSTLIFEDNVQSIGEYACRSFFNNSSESASPKLVVIGKNVNSIGYGAFWAYEAAYPYGDIYIKATVPPTLSSGVFDKAYGDGYGGTSYSVNKYLKIYVPENAVYSYKVKWSRYKDLIVGYDFDEDPNTINNL